MDFNSSGSKFFTLTSLTRERPFGAYGELTELKYDVLEDGHNIEYFHATEDKQAVRDRVFSIIGQHVDKFRIDSIIVEKRKTHRSLQDPEKFYCMILGLLLRYVFNAHPLSNYTQVIIITDRLPDKGKSKLEKAIRKTMKEYLPDSVSYRILHHQSKSNFYLQIVDYCNWAIFRKWEQADQRSYALIRTGVKSEFDVFRRGNIYHY